MGSIIVKKNCSGFNCVAVMHKRSRCPETRRRVSIVMVIDGSVLHFIVGSQPDYDREAISTQSQIIDPNGRHMSLGILVH
jgi:Fe-S cluster assembly iron-binding protein IscA